MALIKMDSTPFLQAGEKEVFKTHAKKSIFSGLETVFCFVLGLVIILGLLFTATALIAALDTAESFGIVTDNKQLFPLVVTLIVVLVVSFIPLLFWGIYSIIKSRNNSSKWYLLTDKRLIIVTDVKPVSATFVNLSEVKEVSATKSSIVFSLGEERVKLKGLTEVPAMLEVIERVVFGDKNKQKTAENSVDKEIEIKEIEIKAPEKTEEKSETEGDKKIENNEAEAIETAESVEKTGEKTLEQAQQPEAETAENAEDKAGEIQAEATEETKEIKGE